MFREEIYLSLLDIQTPDTIAKRMLEIADIAPDVDVVYDIGCGNGRIPIMAVKYPFFAKKAVGIEINPKLYNKAIENAEIEIAFNRIEILNKNVFECDLSEADVVCLDFSSSGNEKLRPKLEEELKPSTRVVCHNFPMLKWNPSEVERFPPKNEKNKTEIGHFIYLYEIQDIYQK